MKSIILLTFIFVLFSVSSFAQTLPTKQIDKGKELSLSEQIGYFRQLSSIENEVDGDNKIVAVRLLNLIVDDVDKRGNSIKRKIPYVEIELFSEVEPPATNSAHFVGVGDQEFNVGGKGCEQKSGCIMVVITLKQFNRLKDNALVSYRIGDSFNSTLLKEANKDGESEMIVGAKFGKLNKKLIDKFPVVQRIAIEN